VVATVDVLVARARSSSGLVDLGPDGWRAGLEHLVQAVERDVRDDPEAVARIEALVVARLVTRLRIESWYAQHGAEAEHRVVGPLLILGLPRSATTALHYLLAVDPQFRYPRAWELSDPVPPPDIATEGTDPRRPREPPAVDVRHITAVDGPAEDWPIHALAFDHAELTLPVPSHSRWWRGANHDSLFPYHERVLELLHSRRPPQTWLLKMPAYLFLLADVAAHYPNARFVMTHRHPVAALPSTCSTVADARRKRTPSWSPTPDFGAQLLEHWADGMRRALAARKALGEDRFFDVAHVELEADPVGTAERVYEFAQLNLTRDVRTTMGRWAEANRRGSRGVHRYSAEEYGLTEADITDAFADYLERFGVYC